MAISEKTLTVEPAQWSAELERMIATALQYASVDNIRSQVESGAATLFVVRSAGVDVAAFVLRVDVLPDRSDGVIVAAAGDLKGVSLTHSVLPVIEQLFVNCQRVRIHTARTGLAKLLAAHHGYSVAEMVLTKELK